jgi:hypothetical protein
MRQPLLLLIALTMLSAQPSLSQKKAPDISKSKNYYLRFTTSTYTQSYTIPFGRIKVVDNRYDTTKFGYERSKSRDYKITVDGSFEKRMTDYLEGYYKKNLDPSSTRTLLIVVKKLWLQFGSTSQMLGSKDLAKNSVLGLMYANVICLADLEVFAGDENEYRALMKIAHNFDLENYQTNNELFSKNRNLALLLMPFDSLMNKVNESDIEQLIAPKKKYSMTAISEIYKKRFALPALSQSGLQKGIYRTFDDFRNNKVIYPDFIYKVSKFSTDITVMQNGIESSITDYWGFFDGQHLYIKPGLLPFAVSKQGNTFDFYGNLGRDVRTNSGVMNARYGSFLANSGNSLIPYYPLQLDMETGKVY